ncbi:Protein of unknown function [Paraburkholderia phenazinium]|uniref:DUF2591 domain-containing protein n=1 Tax=Paraburkholderia phenazinium TaxID=60549 RepID=A0A1G7YHD0_9BURK|nr:phage protein NinX family protein [Paraburkholderia phenazinium]SDG95754.1 Protein of unknown function [Paraburkholderia phenazinium]
MTTIKINTADLIGRALDWAVATAIDAPFTTGPFSTDWALGGPILELHGVGFFRNGKRVYTNEGKRWEANRIVNLDEAPILRHGYRAHGPTPLVAGLRCLVRSKLGETVAVPANLVEA